MKAAWDLRAECLDGAGAEARQGGRVRRSRGQCGECIHEGHGAWHAVRRVLGEEPKEERLELRGERRCMRPW